MAGPNIGFATVSVVPSVRGFQAALGSQLDAPLAAAGASGGRKAASAISSELGNIKISSAQFAKIGTALTAAGAVAAVGLFKIGDAFQQVNRTIIVGTGASGAALQGLNDDARAVARGTASSFGDVGTAIADLNTRLGLTGVPLQEITDQFLDLSRLTNTDIGQNVADITRVFGDWQIATNQQSATLDKLFIASQSTGIGIEQLNQQVVQFGAPLRGLGFEFDEAVALFAQFEKEGVNTTTVLAGLRRGLSGFARAGEEPAEAFERLVEQIKNAGTEGEATALGFEAFGDRAGVDLALAIREGRFETEELVNTLRGSKGALDETAAAAETLQERFSKAFNNLQIGLEPIADATLSGFERLAGIAETVSERFAQLPTGVKDVGGSLAAAAVAGSLLAGSLSLMAAAAIKARGALAALTTQSRLLGIALKGAIPIAVAFGLGDAVGTAIDNATGRTRRLKVAVENLSDALSAGAPSVERFFQLSGQSDSNNIVDYVADLVKPGGAFTRFIRQQQDAYKGQVELADGSVQSFRAIEAAINQTAEQGSQALGELQRQIIAEREELDVTSKAWEDYGRILDAITAKRAAEFGLPSDGKAVGALIASINLGPQNNPLETFGSKIIPDFTRATLEGADASADFATALAVVERQAALAALSVDASANAASSFAASLERSSGAGLLSAGLSAGGALRQLREGFFPDPVAADQSASATTRASKAVDQLRDSLSKTSPAASAAAINLDALSAASTAFSNSLEGSNRFTAQIGSALNLSEAFQDFRRTIRRLPEEIDVTGISLDKLRPRTREAIRNVLSLGDASRDYLSTLLETGESTGKVRSEADRLRDAFADQLRQAGLTESQVGEYIKTLGLTPEAVETAIKLSGAEEARFKLEAYIGLLDGRIPDVLSSAIVADIESGNIEAAIARLAELARRDPPRIDIEVGIDEPSVSRAKNAVKVLSELPATFDPLRAALGGYSEAQQQGLEAVVAVSEAGREYLGQLVALGDYDGAREAALALRDGYGEVVRELGPTNIALEDYVELLGLSDRQIETAISVAGFDEAVFKLQFLRDLLKNEDGSGIPESVESFIAVKVAEGDFATAANVLSAYTTDIQDGLIDNPLLLAFFPDLAPVDEGLRTFTVDLSNRRPGDYPLLPIGAETVPASEEVRRWGDEIQGRQPGQYPALPVGGNLDPARDGVNAFGIELDKLPPFKVEVEAELIFPPNSLLGLIERQGGLPPGFRSQGGPIEAGRPYVVGEFGPELIVPTGNNTVLNQNQLANMGGGGRGEFNYTVVEAQTKPRPEDVFRVMESAEFLAGFTR